MAVNSEYAEGLAGLLDHISDQLRAGEVPYMLADQVILIGKAMKGTDRTVPDILR